MELRGHGKMTREYLRAESLRDGQEPLADYVFSGTEGNL